MALSWKHVVPWANRAEFVQTYQDLYSQDTERQHRAVEKIALWECRVHNKLSVAIESSASLTQAQLLYQAAQQKGQLGISSFMVKSTMTLALIRFVNHITEKGQNKPFAVPVHKIAEEYGIPEWIVRLRHDGTHGPVPCMELLCRGVQWALAYLQEVFWSQQVKEPDQVGDPSSRKRRKLARGLYSSQDIQDLVHTYRDNSYKSLGEAEDSEAVREEKRVLKRLEHILNGQQRNAVLRSMVESGHMIPTEQQQRLYHLNLQDSVRAEPPRVPEVLVKIWRGLLRAVQERHLTELLLQHLLTSLVNSADPMSTHCLVITAWLRLVLLYNASNYPTTEEERESQPALFSGPVDFSTQLLLITCLQSPSVITCPFLRLTNTGSLSEDTLSRVEEVVQISRGRGLPSAAATEAPHTEQDSDTREPENRLKPTTLAVQYDNPWKMCTDPVDWEYVPIGALSSEVWGAGTGAEFSPNDYSSTSDNEGRSSEEEPNSTTFEPPANNSRKRSPEKLQDDIKKRIRLH